MRLYGWAVKMTMSAEACPQGWTLPKRQTTNREGQSYLQIHMNWMTVPVQYMRRPEHQTDRRPRCPQTLWRTTLRENLLSRQASCARLLYRRLWVLIWIGNSNRQSHDEGGCGESFLAIILNWHRPCHQGATGWEAGGKTCTGTFMARVITMSIFYGQKKNSFRHDLESFLWNLLPNLHSLQRPRRERLGYSQDSGGGIRWTLKSYIAELKKGDRVHMKGLSGRW